MMIEDEQNTLFYRTQIKFILGKLLKKVGEEEVLNKTPIEQ